MITIKHVSVTFNPKTPLEKKALRDINLSLAKGEFVTLVGGNGAGKSTLLRMLAGEIIPDSGAILFDNIDVTNDTVMKRSKFISRVFQDPLVGTFDALTVEENLAIALHRGNKRTLTPALNATTRELFREQLAALGIGLEKRLTTRASLLSGGQRQALSLVMATLLPAKLLLLDEHTAALDKKTEKIILNITEKLIAEHQLTTIMITHNLSHALEMGTRTIVMQEGKISRQLSGNEREQFSIIELLDLL